MDEVSRQFYLAQMGISLWEARSVARVDHFAASQLPPESDDEPWPFGKAVVNRRSDSRVSQRKSQRPSPEPVTNRVAGLKNLLSSGEAPTAQASGGMPEAARDENAEPAPKRVVAPEVETETGSPMPSIDAAEASALPDDETSALPDLDLAFWSGHRFRLVTRWSPDASAALQASLAQNILKALGDEAQTHQRVVWPVFSNPGILRNTSLVRENLVNLVSPEGRLQEVWLGCGQTLEGLIESLPEKVLIFESNVAEISADGSLKRALWERLRREGFV